MNYKGFDSAAWLRSGILAIGLGFVTSAISLYGMLRASFIGRPTVKNQLVIMSIGLIIFIPEVIVQVKGCRQLLYSVVANNVGNVATPCEKVYNKQILLWIVFTDLCIFAISYGVSLGFGNKLFLAIGMPIIGVALFTVMGFAIKKTVQYKRMKRNNQKESESQNPEKT